MYQIDQIVRASVLHDIGKIGIPDSILLKPGRLTKEEFEMMKSHTTIGCDILEKAYRKKTVIFTVTVTISAVITMNDGMETDIRII
ncbi:hypothetical protein C823_002132 [Eubacterium plexicaudatum ASF492]|nr:hypothetical protein C823_002132 [Eubacterium plexicaudatum ASF492]